MKTKIVAVHGIKLNRNDQFADKFIETMGDEYTHFKLNWGKFVGIIFDRYFRENYTKPKKRHFIHMKTYKIRRLFWEVVGDVLVYFTRREQIIDQLYNEIKDQEKVVIVAHSMGCIIVDEMLKKYKPNNVIKVITMGSPLAIFRLGHLVPENRPARKFYDWDNYYEHNDWIACKLSKVRGYEFVNDIEFKAKGLRSFSILAHTTYWRSKELHEDIKTSVESGLM